MEYDLIVVGGGPAGYVGAIRSTQLGKKTICVELERAGGTCLNWGCIPTKALLKSAELFETFAHAEDYGLKAGQTGFDFGKIISRSRAASDRMAKGVEFLFKSKGVESLTGRGQIQTDKSVVVKKADGTTQKLMGKNILVCTGAKARPLPGAAVDGKRVHTSRTILENTTFPKSLIVIGAGAIGVEFSYFFSTLGSKVTLVEMLPTVLPVEDLEISEQLKKDFTRSGIEILTETKVEKVEVKANGVKVTLGGANAKAIEAEMILMAIGVEAQTEGLLAPGVQLAMDRGFIKTNDRYETSMKGVYAAGDIIGPPWLAHVASHEAIEAVEGMFVPGKQPHKVTVFPGCTYCQPQVASIGLTEAQVKEKGLKYKVSKYPYRANGKAVGAGETEGFVKLISGEPHGEILGAHIIGAEATELIAELGLAINLEATMDELVATIHAHPTLSEMIHEAAFGALGRPIHL